MGWVGQPTKPAADLAVSLTFAGTTMGFTPASLGPRASSATSLANDLPSSLPGASPLDAWSAFGARPAQGGAYREYLSVFLYGAVTAIPDDCLKLPASLAGWNHGNRFHSSNGFSYRICPASRLPSRRPARPAR